MKIRNLILSSVAACTLLSCSTVTDVAPYTGSITQVPFDQVSLQDDFWVVKALLTAIHFLIDVHADGVFACRRALGDDVRLECVGANNSVLPLMGGGILVFLYVLLHVLHAIVAAVLSQSWACDHKDDHQG